MGTKQRRDLLTNANVILEPVWPADVAAGAPPVLVPPPATRSEPARALALLLLPSAAEPDCVQGGWPAGAQHSPGVLCHGQKRSRRGRHDNPQRVRRDSTLQRAARANDARRHAC
jgi:hypothetical protein